MKYWVIILSMVASSSAWSQANFQATVSKTKASTSDRIEVNFTVDYSSKVSQFKAPSMRDFVILGGPFQSSSYTNYNGKSARSLSYKYVIQARKAGTFTIDPASIVADGTSLKTTPITLSISEKPVAQEQEEEENSSDLTGYLRNNFFVRAEVSDANIYKGESITVSYNLYANARSDIADYRVNGATKVPAFDGFYAEDIDVSHIQGEYKTINGTTFLVQPVKRVKLTAQRPGDLMADPITIDATLSIRTKKSSGFFGRGYERYNYTATSPATKIIVHDLPANPPESFIGAVGDFNMKTSISTTETSTDEPITYRIEISGKGNLTLFNPPTLTLPPGWETYEPNVEGGKDRKTYEYLLIPRNPGTFDIPSHAWSYFDPKEKQYFTLQSDAYEIKVEEGKNYAGTSTTPGKEDMEQLAKDIHFIHKDAPSRHKNNLLDIRSPLFLAGIGTPLLAGLFLLLVNIRQRKNYDPIGERNKQAGAVARKRLQQAKLLSEQKDMQAFCDEGIRVIWGYLGDKYQIPHSELHKDKIAEVLRHKLVDESVIASTLQLLQQYEIALFAPALADSNIGNQYQKLETWIIDMEKESHS